MCNAFSSIVQKDGEVVWLPAEDGHEELIAAAHLTDRSYDPDRRNWLRMESLPPSFASSMGSIPSSHASRRVLSEYFGEEFKIVVDDTKVKWYGDKHEDAVRRATMQWRDTVVRERLDDRIILHPDHHTVRSPTNETMHLGNEYVQLINYNVPSVERLNHFTNDYVGRTIHGLMSSLMNVGGERDPQAGYYARAMQNIPAGGQGMVAMGYWGASAGNPGPMGAGHLEEHMRGESLDPLFGALLMCSYLKGDIAHDPHMRHIFGLVRRLADKGFQVFEGPNPNTYTLEGGRECVQIKQDKGRWTNEDERKYRYYSDWQREMHIGVDEACAYPDRT